MTMNTKEIKRLSKFLSLVLRHRPETIGLTLDEGGWADVDELLVKSQSRQVNLDPATLRFIVEHNDKQRFAFSDDSTKIRASQGHSLPVRLGLEAKQPPKLLYHGTATRNLDSIKAQGLLKGARHHVHLSEDEDTARKVGMRYGTPVVLRIDAERMYQDGTEFYQSENGVWLTETVASHYVVFKE